MNANAFAIKLDLVMTACGFVTLNQLNKIQLLLKLRPCDDCLRFCDSSISYLAREIGLGRTSDLVMTACGVKNKKDITVFTVMSFLFFLQKKFKIYAVLKILNRYLFKNK